MKNHKRIASSCYECGNFVMETQGGYGKCLNPVDPDSIIFGVPIKYFKSWNYPKSYYPTGGIYAISGCKNFKEQEEK
jgi:hypothetical protein